MADSDAADATKPAVKRRRLIDSESESDSDAATPLVQPPPQSSPLAMRPAGKRRRFWITNIMADSDGADATEPAVKRRRLIDSESESDAESDSDAATPPVQPPPQSSLLAMRPGHSDAAVFLAYQHDRHMCSPEAIDEEEATTDDGGINRDYIDAVFSDIDGRGGVRLVAGKEFELDEPAWRTHYIWPDTGSVHAFDEGPGSDLHEKILRCWQARRGSIVVGHVWAWAYSATTRT